MNDSLWLGWDPFADWLLWLDQSKLAPIDWRLVGRESFKPGHVPIAATIIRNTLSVRSAYWIAAKWFGPSQFRVVNCVFEDLGPRQIRETLSISPALKESPQAFEIFHGTLEVMSNSMFRLPCSQVQAKIGGRKAIYDITLPTHSSVWQKVFYKLKNLKHQSQLILELANAQTALNSQTHRLVEERSELKQLLSHFPDGIMIHRRGVIVYANQRMASFLQYTSPSELAGKHCLDVISPENHEVIKQRLSLNETIEEYSSVTIEINFHKQNSTDLFEGECTSMSFSFEGSPAVIVVTRDIRERRKHQSLMLSTDRLISLGQLAAGVGHEINNPLCFVMMKLELVSEQINQDGNPTLKRQISEMSEGLCRIQNIVKDLKALSRNPTEETTKVDLAVALRSAISMANNEIHHRAEVFISIENMPPVLGNEAQFGQVFLNLLINAAQAIEPGNAKNNLISIKAFSESGIVTIQISDSGCGISEQVRKNIFNPFFTTKLSSEGTGLGLSICQSIVNRYGGQIRFDSKVGKGTTFTITLNACERPMVITEMAKNLDPHDKPMICPRGRILIIDDDKVLLETLSEIIAPAHDTLPLIDANWALTLIEQGEKFDAILCDLMMPNLGGVEFYSKLQKISPQHCPRVLFLTGGSFTQLTEKFLSQPEIRHCQKPIRNCDLLNELNTIAMQSLGEKFQSTLQN